MSLEGLELILSKKEVVPTVSALDLLERPEQVEADYLRHVRTYVPISRAAEGIDGQLNVETFERKVIQQVKEARAPRGYITAEYGYGKTSTALYLWQRAEQQKLVVVPPFQLLELADLVTAAYGWVHFKLKNSRPALVPALESLYQNTIDLSLEKLANERNLSLAALQTLVHEQRLTVELQPADYIRFFESITDLVIKADFEGLIILPDEIQQYIEPKLASKLGDPISPFFNLVQGLATRAGYLRFGFIMVIPLKEIGVIREARGRDDVLHRMKDLSLDLTSVYDPEFARRLWDMLAREFQFTEVASAIVRPETLESLGQIASREDISNGPRTVINVFRRMVELYFRAGHAHSQPYTPIDLVQDFMDEQAIQFSGNNKIRTITRQVLQSAIVRRDLERYENAIKLAAAFPTEGVSRHLQKQYGVDVALKELMDQAIGELVMAVGPVDDGGITLSKLDRAEVSTDWLTQTIRDFRRAYGEAHNSTRDRAVEVFTTLLRNVVFKNWKVIEERPSNFTSNLSIVFEGDFPSFSAKFPKRRVQARIFWEDEERKDDTPRGDIVIEYYLSIHSNEEERKRIARPAELYPDYASAIVPINLMYVRPEGIPLQIQHMLQGVWSPYELTPLILMNIYHMLDEKRADSLIPKRDDQVIKTGFQPDILDNVMRDLFNAEVGASLGAAGVDLTELAVKRLLEARYDGKYHTIMAVANWRSSLQKYIAALDRLDNIYKKRGEVEIEGKKDQIAELLVLSNTGLDSFIRTFDKLIEVTQDWTSRDTVGAVRFGLHPLEQQIMKWLLASNRTERVQQETVHVLNISDVFSWARDAGYQSDEISELINLLSKRDAIEVYQQHLIREIPTKGIDPIVITMQLRSLDEDLRIMMRGFPNNVQLLAMKANLDRWQGIVEKELLSGSPDPKQVDRLGRAIQKEQDSLRLFATESQRTLRSQITTLAKGLRPMGDERLSAINKPIEGIVVYVDQVNVLRTTLHRLGTSGKSSIQHAKSEIDAAVTQISQEGLGYEILAQIAQSLSTYETQVEKANRQVEDFEEQFRHLGGWRSLVNDGSQLYESLQQMDQVTRTQAEEFDHLARDIRADISSRANKLDALPNYSIYAHRLADIQEQVRKIREDAQRLFTELQGRYRQALTSENLYRVQQLDRPFEYNFSNPADSYRLLESSIQEKLEALAKKMMQLAINQRQKISNTLSTPLIDTLTHEVRQRVREQGAQLNASATQMIDDLFKADAFVRDITLIRDFSAENQGQFVDLIRGFVNIRNTLAQLTEQTEEISRWLADFALTTEEQYAFDQLLVEDNESSEDLIEWRNRTQVNDDMFWSAVRNLYEKQRVRILVSRVRR